MELSSQWATALEPNILKWMHEGFETYPDSTTEVFNIINESAASYRFHDSWGPKQIPKSSEGAATTELNRQKGYFIALVKSFLIDSEVLIKRITRANPNRDAERLNGKTPIYWGCNSLNRKNK